MVLDKRSRESRSKSKKGGKGTEHRIPRSHSSFEILNGYTSKTKEAMDGSFPEPRLV